MLKCPGFRVSTSSADASAEGLQLLEPCRASYSKYHAHGFCWLVYPHSAAGAVICCPAESEICNIYRQLFYITTTAKILGWMSTFWHSNRNPCKGKNVPSFFENNTCGTKLRKQCWSYLPAPSYLSLHSHIHSRFHACCLSHSLFFTIGPCMNFMQHFLLGKEKFFESMVTILFFTHNYIPSSSGEFNFVASWRAKQEIDV